MGYLSGEPSYLDQITPLQISIAKILVFLNLQEIKQAPFIYHDQIANISNDWKTILIGWKDDKVLHNFEFHCHLVETLKKLLRNCMKEHLLPQLNRSGVDYQTLLDAIFIEIPNNIESLAILRGLSTNAAVIKACGSESHAKLSYLLKEIPFQNKQLIAHIGHLMPELKTIKEQNIQLHKFLLSIQMSILDSEEITVDSSTLFTLSTEIINAHWFAIEQGILKVENLSFKTLIQ